MLDGLFFHFNAFLLAFSGVLLAYLLPALATIHKQGYQPQEKFKMLGLLLVGGTFTAYGFITALHGLIKYWGFY